MFANALLITAALLLLVPALTLLLEVLVARAAEPPAIHDDIPSLAVLVPAHNEGDGISATLRDIRLQLRPGDRMVVVADNCSDDTAAIATQEGAEVAVRQDPQRRGKGYALDFGVRHIEQSTPPGVVIIIDADCRLGPDCLRILAGQVQAHRRPIQALYSMLLHETAGVGARISALAWIVRNHVRPLGAARLGLPCQLMGTGMAFEWSMLQGARLATGEIVEDLVLGIEMAQRGQAPLFEPAARVSSTFAVNDEAQRDQRQRWEHGHLSAIAQHGPRLLLRGLATRSRMQVGMALDLFVPPLAVLCLLLVGFVVGALGLWWLDPRFWLAFVLGTIALAATTLAVVLAWYRFGRAVASAGQLLFAPLYALSKLGSYAQLAIGRRSAWVRAKRNHE